MAINYKAEKSGVSLCCCYFGGCVVGFECRCVVVVMMVVGGGSVLEKYSSSVSEKYNSGTHARTHAHTHKVLDPD